jgi:hypothetical protein
MGCCIKTEYSVRVPEKTVLILVRNFLYMHSTLPRIATTAVCIACQSMLCRPSHLSEISVGCYCAICQSLDYPLEDMGSFALGIIRSDNDDYRASAGGEFWRIPAQDAATTLFSKDRAGTLYVIVQRYETHDLQFLRHELLLLPLNFQSTTHPPRMPKSVASAYSHDYICVIKAIKVHSPL